MASISTDSQKPMDPSVQLKEISIVSEVYNEYSMYELCTCGIATAVRLLFMK